MRKESPIPPESPRDATGNNPESCREIQVLRLQVIAVSEDRFHGGDRG